MRTYVRGSSAVKTRLAIATTTAATAALVVFPAGASHAAPSGGCTYPPNPEKLTVSVWRPNHTPAQSVTVFKGGHVNISGFFTQSGCGIKDALIKVVFKSPGARWATVGTDTTNGHGSYLVQFTAQVSGVVRADFAGGGRFGPLDSGTATVNVH
jgi:hypothetical protein